MVHWSISETRRTQIAGRALSVEGAMRLADTRKYRETNELTARKVRRQALDRRIACLFQVRISRKIAPR